MTPPAGLLPEADQQMLDKITVDVAKYHDNMKPGWFSLIEYLRWLLQLINDLLHVAGHPPEPEDLRENHNDMDGGWYSTGYIETQAEANQRLLATRRKERSHE